MKEILLLLVMFWNVENYFDTYDNPSTTDEEFTPTGDNRWGRARFEKKRDDIAKTILLAADQYGDLPALIGLAEVENAFVLQELLEETPLARTQYKYIHKDSPDSRGIDVALLYREELFTPLETKYIGFSFPTRDVLYTKGVVNGLDTLHIMVNHWPSKRGNEESSGRKREYVSLKVSHVVDSILLRNPAANIVLMGDFNDTPDSSPLKNLEQLTNLA
jgi:predicted extracellular nuclease